MKDWLAGLQQDVVEDYVSNTPIVDTAHEIVQCLRTGDQVAWIVQYLDDPRSRYVCIEQSVTITPQDSGPPLVDIQLHMFTVCEDRAFGKWITRVVNEWREPDRCDAAAFKKFCVGLRVEMASRILRRHAIQENLQ